MVRVVRARVVRARGRTRGMGGIHCWAEGELVRFVIENNI